MSAALSFGGHRQTMMKEESGLYFRYLGVQAQRCVRRHVRNDRRIKNKQQFMKQFKLFELDAGITYNSFLSAYPSDSTFDAVMARRQEGVFSGRRRQSIERSER